MPAKAARWARRIERIIRPAVEHAARAKASTPRAAAGRYDVSCARARRLRRGDLHVSRPGADPGQGAGLRRAVNVTLGLPFIRTSPDHGTAFDIAGKGIARADSLIAALKLARRLADTGTKAQPHERMSMSIDGLPPLREVIERHGLQAKKALGQNFLLDLNLTGKIARAAGDLGDTHGDRGRPRPRRADAGAAAHGARRVIAIERDERCLPALAEIADHYPGRLEVIAGDALKTDFAALASRVGRRPGEDRRQPALQYRHRAADPLADGRRLAAVLCSR